MRQRRALDERRKTLDRAVAAIDWELREAELLKCSSGVRRAPDRFNEARVSLDHDVAAAIEAGAADGVNSDCAQALYQLEPAAWERVADFVERGVGGEVRGWRRTSNLQPVRFRA
jgi:hypothetical protein